MSDEQQETQETREDPGQKPRVFHYDGRIFPDPDPTKTPEEVRAMMCDFFPELANAEIRTVERGEDTLHVLERRVGTKG